jgi:hypothetical protein
MQLSSASRRKPEIKYNGHVNLFLTFGTEGDKTEQQDINRVNL